MRILFLMKVFEIGGIEVVTSILAKKFIDEKHEVSIVSLNQANNIMLARLDKRIKFYTLNGFNTGLQNQKDLRYILIKNKIDIIINQWGLPFIPLKLIKKASKGLSCKIISVYHNDPKANAKILDCIIKKEQSKNFVIKKGLELKEKIYTYITGLSMKYVYKNSDKFVILSQSFTNNFINFTKLHDTNKLTVITNPITISSDNFNFDYQQKRKEIIYVGRIDYNQKRVSRIMNIWKNIYPRFPDWYLKIIGDGPEKKKLEQFVKNEQLKNISFEGFQDPKCYYEKASIILLTSEYEGFGLVIVEAMSFGVIPIVYGSYKAIYDIIENGEDGYIVEPINKTFPLETMTQKVSDVIENISKNNQIALNAIKKSKEFSLETIYQKWYDLFKEISA